MNKGSWRMLQDTTIYATLHRLNKAKNNKTTDDCQISICEGQVHLAGAYTQGQKKAQRCFIILFPTSSKSNWFQNALLPILSDVPFSKDRRIFPVTNPRVQLCQPQWCKRLQCLLFPHTLRKRRHPASLWLLLLHVIPSTTFTNRGTLRISERTIGIADF